MATPSQLSADMAVGGLVGAVAGMNNGCVNCGKTPPEFQCSALPPMSVAYFLQKLRKLALPSTWIVSLILVDKFCRSTGCFLDPLNVHRIALTALVVAMKLSYDNAGVSGAVARVIGLGTGDLMRMETVFLNSIQWELHVDPAHYSQIVESLPGLLAAAYAAKKHDESRGVDVIPSNLQQRTTQNEQRVVPPVSNI